MLSTVALIVLLAVGTASYPIYSSGTAGRCVDSAGQEVKHVHKASGSSGDCEGECTAWGASCQAYSFYPPGSMCNLYGGSVHDGSAGDYVNGWRIGGSTSVNSPVEGANAPSLPDSTSWSCHVKDESATEASYIDWGTGNGWCSSDLDEWIGSTSDANACWTMCENYYPFLVAIDWTPDGECYCQDDCRCMDDTQHGEIHLITRSDLWLPNACSAPTCPGQMDCHFGYGCAADEFCNFDGGSYGSCEKCSDEDHCDRGLPEAGEADCEACCGIKKESKRDNVGLLILIIVCSVMGVCCLLAISTAIIAKHKKKRVAEPSAPSAPVPLVVATYAAEAPPSPGPPPLAPIKATETLPAERP